MTLNVPALTYEQWSAVRMRIREWMVIRYKNHPEQLAGHFTSAGAANQFLADLDHSALLARMLVEGKDPLPEPPPLRHSYPDYEAVSG